MAELGRITCGGVLRRKRKIFFGSAAFTALELLVVISVIAILATFCLPALSRAKVKSQTTVCESNLHQLGVALQMYLEDSAGVYPYTVSFPTANTRGSSFWFDALALVLPNAKWGEGIFKCPGYQGVVYEGETRFNNQGALTAVYSPCGGYAYNALGRRNPSGAVSAGLGFTVYAGQPLGQPIHDRDVRSPADMYTFGDAPLSTAPWGTVAALRLGGAADFNSFLSDEAIIEKAQHSVVFNMLLADSHTESVRTNILLGTNAVCRSRWNHDGLP